MTVQVKGAVKSATPKLQIKEVALASLVQYENNPRNNEPHVPKMVELLKKFGFRIPMLVKGNEIVDGHLRYKAATALGLTTVPVLDVGDMPDADIRALRLVINKSVEWSAWDDEKLGQELKGIKAAGLSLDLTGFDGKEVGRLMQGLAGKPLNLGVPTTKNKAADAGLPPDPASVGLTFQMSDIERTLVLSALEEYRTKYDLKTHSQALVALLTPEGV